nr:uncharacterized protein LOC113703745 [Coffea arabica]
MLKRQLKEAYEEEEMFWSQKSRVQWLKEGDRNTHFFHSSVKGRRQRNKLHRLLRENGDWTNSEEEIGEEVVSHYKDLFCSKGTEQVDMVLEGISQTITDQMNLRLTEPVREAEIKEALFSMNPTKAPGPDGMTPNFFQKFWNILKTDVIQAITSFFHSGHMLKAVNHTIISLIPKVENPTDIKQFRPISLCNVIYKIISKILANRLKKVLDNCISKNQAAFVPGRQILDNVIVSHEYMHYLKNKRQGSQGFMALKLDMSKAYDRVKWGYLKEMMIKLGFCEKWIRWIMECITTATFSFNINGEARGYVIPSRGIRQGDPLSPYLFLLVSEGFSNLLAQAESNQKLTGMKISRSGPAISHLFFADDSLIFCKADTSQAEEVLRILEKYGKGSGQMINMDKSSVFFSKNVTQEDQEEICSRLGNIRRVHQGKYLGLPMVITRTKEQIFGYIRDKCQKKVSNWCNKKLSQVGKEVLLKAITMAMPTYAMSCFKLPVKLCKDIHALMAKFWWGGDNEKRKVHWCSWKKMAAEKNRGGLGFRDLQAFNKALLGKQIWRLLTSPNLLMSKVLKAKYYWKESPLSCEVKGNSSWIWKSLMGAREEVKRGVRKRIGNGKGTRIWEDAWIQDGKDGKLESPKPTGCLMSKVSELISNSRWNSPLVFRTFNTREAGQILKTPVSLTGRPDCYSWSYSTNGQYTVRSAYEAITREGKQQESNGRLKGETSWEGGSEKVWKQLWKLKIKHKQKLFIWKSLNQVLPGREAIYKRIGKGDMICKLCGEGSETVEHIFFHCTKAQMIWQMAPLQWDGIKEHTADFRRWWSILMEAQTRREGLEHIALTVEILWQIWKARNEAEFEEKDRHPMEVIRKAIKDWEEYQQAQQMEHHMSISKTEVAQEDEERLREEDNLLNISVEVGQHAEGQNMGIGVTAENNRSQKCAAWILKERSTGSAVVDNLMAIKLALCKLNEKGWQYIKIQTPCTQVLNMLRPQATSNSRLVTHLEDIRDLSSMFRKCSFDSLPVEVNRLSEKLSKLAMRIL